MIIYGEKHNFNENDLIELVQEIKFTIIESSNKKKYNNIDEVLLTEGISKTLEVLTKDNFNYYDLENFLLFKIDDDVLNAIMGNTRFITLEAIIRSDFITCIKKFLRSKNIKLKSIMGDSFY